jgi:hypothetical protein
MAEKCPSCGLSGHTLREVEAARKARADEELTKRYEQAVIRASRAEAAYSELLDRLIPAREVFAALENGDPSP